MKILFLFTEIAGYFANCIDLLKQQKEVEVTAVYFPNSAKAPFRHDLNGIELVNKRDKFGKPLVEQCLSQDYSIVYVAGWTDRDYMRIAKAFKKRGTIVISGLDNIWKGTLRQHLACTLSVYLIKPYFTHFWVAGHRQYQFARRLGFSYNNILTGLYAADVEMFKSVKLEPHEHRLVFVGRFEPIKGIRLLYDVFSALKDDERKGWILDIIGNGTLKENMLPTSKIRIHDFMQPKDLVSYIRNAGGFILPSVEEPWGVVVQEFGAAGKPLILSNAVNSGEDYLIHGYNGFKFNVGDANELKKTLIKFISLDDEIRSEMGQRSTELALRGDPKYWVANLLSLRQ